MIKKCIALLLALTAVFCCTACGGQTETAPAQDADLSAVMQEIRTAVTLPEMMDLTEESLMDYFGIDAALLADSAACINANGYEKEEIVLLRAVDDNAAAVLTEKLNVALQNAADEMRNYLPEQYTMVQNSRVQSKGLYVWLFISNANDQMQAILDQYL